MLLQTNQLSNMKGEYDYLIEKYKSRGIIKKYDNDCEYNFEKFEWIQKFMHCNNFDN